MQKEQTSVSRLDDSSTASFVPSLSLFIFESLTIHNIHQRTRGREWNQRIHLDQFFAAQKASGRASLALINILSTQQIQQTLVTPSDVRYLRVALFTTTDMHRWTLV